jgi:hypothetical protein
MPAEGFTWAGRTRPAPTSTVPGPGRRQAAAGRAPVRPGVRVPTNPEPGWGHQPQSGRAPLVPRAARQPSANGLLMAVCLLLWFSPWRCWSGWWGSR